MAPKQDAKGCLSEFYRGIMRQKQIDHEASHANLINQYLHLWSSAIFLWCYATFAVDYRRAVYWGLFSLIIRQSGHYIFEPPCHDKEQAMLGFDTAKKVKIVLLYFTLPTVMLIQLTQWGRTKSFFTRYDIAVADLWLVATVAVVGGRTLFLWSKYGFLVSQHWLIKFVTDPFTDIPAYYRSSYQILSKKNLHFALHKSFPATFGLPEGMDENTQFNQHNNPHTGKRLVNDDGSVIGGIVEGTTIQRGVAERV
eukprot:CAMPEP_0181318376 /NCGR_PEP_ID=MMETSP1101-20121128/16971_1 /TAXON_ID=46948 /ORGANISM="Rhodomonas abbreviata, Strain Caron Lab Isolate" /LENGTH=252 /DNA_ID=CAMNT_0023425837 /DNA_START=48 /DNA_END=806 /DNA_ORIENTATION=+